MSRAPIDLDRWNADIREPADRAAEEPRVLTVSGATASYQVAPLPYGRFAVKVTCKYECGDNHGMMIPWRAFSTREACVAFFLEQAGCHFAMGVSVRVAGAQGKARREMQELLLKESRRDPDEQEPVQGLLF